MKIWRTVLVVVVIGASAYAQDDVVARARQLAIAGNRADAIAMLEQRLAVKPDDIDARTLLGIVLSWDHQYGRARTELQNVLARDPNNADAKQALANVERWSAQSQPVRGEVMLGANYDHYHRGDPWREAFVTVKAGPPAVPVVFRAARARYYSLNDNQFELEAYPKFGNNTYAYLAAGYSPEERLYPHSRYGAELFHTFPHAWEFSAGARRLNFVESVDVYTASVGKYIGDWFVDLRGYKAKDTNTAQLFVRRYFGAPGQYVGIRAGRGSTRDDIRSAADLAALDIREIVAETQLVLQNRWLVNARAGAGHALHGAGNTSTASLALGARF